MLATRVRARDGMMGLGVLGCNAATDLSERVSMSRLPLRSMELRISSESASW